MAIVTMKEIDATMLGKDLTFEEREAATIEQQRADNNAEALLYAASLVAVSAAIVAGPFAPAVLLVEALFGAGVGGTAIALTARCSERARTPRAMRAKLFVNLLCAFHTVTGALALPLPVAGCDASLLGVAAGGSSTGSSSAAFVGVRSRPAECRLAALGADTAAGSLAGADEPGADEAGYLPETERMIMSAPE